MRSITLDIETTGLSFLEGHKIVEIGCVELLNNVPSGNTWQRYINPKRSMPEEAFKIHRFPHRILIQFYSVLDSNLVPYGVPRRAQISPGWRTHSVSGFAVRAPEAHGAEVASNLGSNLTKLLYFWL